MRHRRVGRSLFQGNNGVGFRAVKVFVKFYTQATPDFDKKTEIQNNYLNDLEIIKN